MPTTTTQTRMSASSSQTKLSAAVEQTLLTVSISSSGVGTPVVDAEITGAILAQNGYYLTAQNGYNLIVQ